VKQARWDSPSSHSALSPAIPGGPGGSAGETASSFSPLPEPSPERSVLVVVLIPAYRPGPVLIDIVKVLRTTDWRAIVVVDDGSGPGYAPIFAEISRIPNVDVVPHAINLGKGSALKAGINFILCAYPEVAGIITVDADGQHDPADVRKVWERFQRTPGAMVLGVRDFEGSVPARSKWGNQITRRVVRAVVGSNLSDSQTGLRAIPRTLLPTLLKVPAAGYEFELEMLIAAKHLGLRVVEQPIRTIYTPGNSSSHFHPLRDSMRIYYVLLRFTFIGLLTAALDNLVFYLLFRATGNILESQIGARLVAVLFNYAAVRRAVFLSDERHRILLPRYVLVVTGNSGLSYAGIRFLTHAFSLSVFPAKIIAEALLFIINFVIQRDFVFTKRASGAAVTDWDRYYERVPFTARLTRRYTQAVLISALRRFAHSKSGVAGTLVEIGGANSCFLDGILEALHPRVYHVVDRNEYGLSLLSHRLNGRRDVILHRGDVLNLPKLAVQADGVFSVGLVEHFDPKGTQKAVEAHFDLLRSGGCAMISFPTPTWLYSLARAACEAFGLWRFPDERPLSRAEISAVVSNFGEIVFEKTLWPLILTQRLMVIRKK
jgi:putative flippase GtrA